MFNSSMIRNGFGDTQKKYIYLYLYTPCAYFILHFNHFLLDVLSSGLLEKSLLSIVRNVNFA